jgi:hypothetical protein
MNEPLWWQGNNRVNVERYRQRAAAYLDMAERAVDGHERALLELAETYRRLASELEEGNSSGASEQTKPSQGTRVQYNGAAKT